MIQASRIFVGPLLSLLAVGLLFSGMVMGAAQSTCEALVAEAFAGLSQNCAEMGGGAACFGRAASATLLEGAEGDFESPGDILPLTNLSALNTSALSPAADDWGLAILNVHANVPLALSEQGLKFIMVGQVDLGNAVDPGSAFVPVDPITVTPLVGANLRSRPSAEGQIVGGAKVGEELAADGRSADSGWLRVLAVGQTAWISRQVVSSEGDLDSLPVITGESQSLMQSFFLHTGSDPATCDGLPQSMLVIQSPAGLTARIAVNGIDIAFESTIVLRTIPGEGLRIFVLDGGARIATVSIPPGFTVNIPLSDDGRQPSGAPSGLRPITGDERGQLSSLTDAVPDEVVYDPLRVPSVEEVQTIQSELNGAVGSVASGAAAGQANCSRFRPTSPLDGLAFGITNFYWDGAPGATSYRIKIYGTDGALRIAVDTSNVTTTFAVDTGSPLGDGQNFSWNVEALVNGQVACVSGRVTLPRAIAAGQPVSGGGSATAVPSPTPPGWSG
jgi:hypothetical protein